MKKSRKRKYRLSHANRGKRGGKKTFGKEKYGCLHAHGQKEKGKAQEKE